MRSNVTKTVSTCYSVLRQLRTIRQSVSRSVLQSLVSSLVLSRLEWDYGNSTLAGVSSHLLSRLQSVMNAGAQLIFSLSKFQHHSAPSSAALAEGFRADCIQTGSPRVQVSTRVCTCIPYWRALSGGRCRGSLATPFLFLLIIDCQPHPTSYCWWPSFPGRRFSCL